MSCTFGKSRKVQRLFIFYAVRSKQHPALIGSDTPGGHTLCSLVPYIPPQKHIAGHPQPALLLLTGSTVRIWRLVHEPIAFSNMILIASASRIVHCALLALLLLGDSEYSAACSDVECYGVDVCSSEGECAAPADCTASNIQDKVDHIEIRGNGCRVTMEAIRMALPDAVTKEGEEYVLQKKVWVRDGCVLEIHGSSSASSSDAAVSLLKLKVRFSVWWFLKYFSTKNTVAPAVYIEHV